MLTLYWLVAITTAVISGEEPLKAYAAFESIEACEAMADEVNKRLPKGQGIMSGCVALVYPRAPS